MKEFWNSSDQQLHSSGSVCLRDQERAMLPLQTFSKPLEKIYTAAGMKDKRCGQAPGTTCAAEPVFWEVRQLRNRLNKFGDVTRGRILDRRPTGRLVTGQFSSP